MASTVFSLDLVKESLVENGFFNLQDSAVGERILDMERRKFPFATAYGLDFCKYVLFHPRIRLILEASFQKCTLGHIMRYSKKPGRVFRFLPGGPNTNFALMVHQCAKGSQVKYYVGSYKYAPSPPNNRKLDSNEPLEPLLEDSQSALVDTGCKPVEVGLKEGGL
ncbi:hypothetical protein F5Y02DRAFT_412233 [Annulohypoxylon stygium]|nr:hypothetical protein F5Y02DRAFT_412233 [Annulohypoxylon stygium]